MDKVIAIHDWWDGPRLGVAYFNGAVYIFNGVFDEAKDDYTDEYDLIPIGEEDKKRIMEDYNNWVNAVEDNDIEQYFMEHKDEIYAMINRVTDSLKNSSQPGALRKKARFSGNIKKGYIPVDYYVEWYD